MQNDFCSLPDFNFRKFPSFFDVVVRDLSISTRSFLIFALHLLFSFQDAFDIDCSAINISLSNFLLILFLSEQISEDSVSSVFSNPF